MTQETPSTIWISGDSQPDPQVDAQAATMAGSMAPASVVGMPDLTVPVLGATLVNRVNLLGEGLPNL